MKKNWFAASKRGPSAPGSKPLPVGKPNCLANFTFVLTGEMPSISREEATDLIKSYGGRVTSAVSSKTTYLVVGDEPGLSKTAKAKSLGVATLTDDDLFYLIQTAEEKQESFVEPKQKQVKENLMPKDNQTSVKKKGKGVVEVKEPKVQSFELWTDRFKPKTIKEICGNKGLVEDFDKWSPYQQKKAALMSGPPGIGKTTAAHLVASLNDYNVIEFNASDTRSKNQLKKYLNETVNSRSITNYFSAGKGKGTNDVKTKKTLVLMDEVDGMSSGDRGGLAELGLIIKKTLVPIVCICNDRIKVRGMANYCHELRFKRPDANQIKSRIMTVCFQEGLQLAPNVVDSLVQSTKGDIRQILNQLSVYRLKSTEMSYADAKNVSEKDITLSVFDVAQKLFQDSGSLRDKLDLFFFDYSLTPLMIQENYLNATDSDDLRAIQRVSEASDSISLGNLMDKHIYEYGSWSLLPAVGVVSSVDPAMRVGGRMKGMYQFPSWLGNNSKAGKYQRTLSALQLHASLSVSCNKEQLRLDYIPLMFEKITGPLVKDQSGIGQVTEFMDEYHLTREHWDLIQELCLLPAPTIATATKSAFTRTWNKSSHKLAVPLISHGAKARASAASIQPDLEEAVEEDQGVQEEVEEEEEKAEVSAMFVKKEKRASKGKAAAPTKKRKTSKK